MSEIELDALYGIRTPFSGIPVRFTDLACRTIHRVKRWKRLNRPSKIKSKAVVVPSAYSFGGTIYAHPALKKQFQSI